MVNDDKMTSGTDHTEGVHIPYRRLNRLLLMASSKELTLGQKTLAVTIVTSIVIISSIIGLYSGMNVIFPHFFYLPIIMVAYWFPHRGVSFSIGLGILYVSEFILFGLILETIPQSEWVPVVSRSMVFVVVGIVLTMLRWEGFTLNRIIGDQDKFVFLLDRDLGYFYFSPSAYELLRKADIKNSFEHGIRSIISEDDRNKFDEAEEKALSGQEIRQQLTINDVEAGRRIYTICFKPLLKEDEVYGYEAIAEDETEIMDYKACLEKAVSEKTALLAELHHRVRNNLASIIGLLNMQIRETEDPDVRRSLMESESRILAVSSVHTLMYEGDDLINIDFEDHTGRLLDDILESSPQKDRLTVNIEGNGLKITHWSITDISMIIGELFTNSLKHAFKDRDGEVTVKLEKDGCECILTLADNGIGLPPDFNIDSNGRLGLKITRRVVEDKLSGHLSWSSEGGTEWTIRFPCGDGEFKVCSDLQ